MNYVQMSLTFVRKVKYVYLLDMVTVGIHPFQSI